MRHRRHIALPTILAVTVPSALAAQTNDLGRSLVRLVDAVATNNQQRKVLLELTPPLAYEPAAGPTDPANRNDPRNLDIAGVRLGMTVRQAQTALRAAGYVDAGPRDTQDSYAATIVYRWHTTYDYKGSLNEHVEKELLWNKGQEEISVKLIALPEGPRVNEINYWAKDGAPISSAEFARRAVAKYGEPVNEDANELRWCTIKAPDCEQYNDAKYPLLVASPSSRHLDLIGNDPARQQAYAERFAADVERRKPAEKVPSF